MFILDNTIVKDVFGMRVMNPKWNLSLKPDTPLHQPRTFVQEHLTYGAGLGLIPLFFGAYKLIIGFFTGEDGLKERIGGSIGVLSGIALMVAGHLCKSNDKKETEEYVQKFSKPPKATNETMEDLVLRRATFKAFCDGIDGVPSGGIVLHMFGSTNLGKSTLLSVAPDFVKKRLEEKLGHEVKVNAIEIPSGFSTEDKNSFGAGSTTKDFKTILKYFQLKLQQANAGCNPGDVNEIYLLQVEETGGMFREDLKDYFEDIANHCPGLCIAFTTNTEYVPDEYNRKRGVQLVPFDSPDLDEKVEILRRKLKKALGDNYSDKHFAQVKDTVTKLLNHNKSNGNGSLSAALKKVDPYNLKEIAKVLAESSNEFLKEGSFLESEFGAVLVRALQEQLNEHIIRDSNARSLSENEVVNFLTSEPATSA